MPAGDLVEVLTFRGGYNTNVVLAGTTLLGIAAGVVGSFAMLRERTLVSDAIGHAALPGVAAAFLLASACGDSGRSVPLLLVGAATTGLLAVLAIEFLARRTRLHTDAATAAVLGSSFGLGVVLLGVVQDSPQGGQAGLASLVFGSASGMLRAEVAWMAALAAGSLALSLLLGRSFTGIAFNERFARASGVPVRTLDLVLAALVAAVTLAGLQAVGMLLAVALLAAPPATARLWTRRVPALVATSAILGATSGFVGTALSATLPDAPTGALIVLVATSIFVASLVAAPDRGLVAIALRRRRLREEAQRAMEGAAGAVE